MVRFPTRQAAVAYAAQTRALADTPTQTAIAGLVRRWALWHYRWSSRPTAANDLREQRAWECLRAALREAEMVDTWLDPRS